MGCSIFKPQVRCTKHDLSRQVLGKPDLSTLGISDFEYAGERHKSCSQEKYLVQELKFSGEEKDSNGEF